MALPTANLSVKAICQTLGVSNPRAIFYNGDGSLKTAAQLGALVSKTGLSSYCPGATADEKLSNLLAYRKLQYFKGYNPVTAYLSVTPGDIYLDWAIHNYGYAEVTSNIVWSVISKPAWVIVSSTNYNGDGRLTIDPLQNSSTSGRSGTIQISGSGITRTINVYQAGMGT